MKLIAGLGNPTSKYEHTRHNAGFDCLDYIAGEFGAKIKKIESKFSAQSGDCIIEGEKVLLVKPQTYMNESGRSLRAYRDYYNLDPARDIIVLSDDVTLAPGNIRIRQKGSAGGHNGLKSIIEQLGTQEFARIRLGVGEAKGEGALVGHVLGHLGREERKLLEEAFERAYGAVRLMLQGDVERAMSLYNAKVV